MIAIPVLQRNQPERSHPELVLEASRGGEQAFQTLHARHNGCLLAFIIRGFVGRQEIAEDIVQIAWLKVYQNLGKFTPPTASFET
jgi:DNA-directed RNA polymerase specialized sigma24 family protein